MDPSSSEIPELAEVYEKLRGIALEKSGNVPLEGRDLLHEYAKRFGERNLHQRFGFSHTAALLKTIPGIHTNRHGDVLAVDDVPATDDGNDVTSKDSLIQELLSLLPALPRLVQLPEVISAYKTKYGKAIAFKAAGCQSLVDLLLRIEEFRRRLILNLLPTATHRRTFQILREIGEPFSHEEFVEAYVANFGAIAPNYEDPLQMMEILFSFPTVEKNSDGLYAFTGTWKAKQGRRVLSKTQMQRQKKKAKKELGDIERRKRAAAEEADSDHSSPKEPKLEENKEEVNEEAKEEIPGYGYVGAPLDPCQH